MSDNDRFEYIRRHGKAPPDDWDSLDERSYDCLQAELTRLRAQQTVLVKTLLHVKSRVDNASGARWSANDSKILDEALATLDVPDTKELSCGMGGRPR